MLIWLCSHIFNKFSFSHVTNFLLNIRRRQRRGVSRSVSSKNSLVTWAIGRYTRERLKWASPSRFYLQIFIFPSIISWRSLKVRPSFFFIVCFSVSLFSVRRRIHVERVAGTSPIGAGSIRWRFWILAIGLQKKGRCFHLRFWNSCNIKKNNEAFIFSILFWNSFDIFAGFEEYARM